MALREARAFDNMNKAIDTHELFERISINNHKSFVPHLCIFKVCSTCAAQCRMRVFIAIARSSPPTSNAHVVGDLGAQ